MVQRDEKSGDDRPFVGPRGQEHRRRDGQRVSHRHGRDDEKEGDAVEAPEDIEEARGPGNRQCGGQHHEDRHHRVTGQTLDQVGDQAEEDDVGHERERDVAPGVETEKPGDERDGEPEVELLVVGRQVGVAGGERGLGLGLDRLPGCVGDGVVGREREEEGGGGSEQGQREQSLRSTRQSAVECNRGLLRGTGQAQERRAVGVALAHLARR